MEGGVLQGLALGLPISETFKAIVPGILAAIVAQAIVSFFIERKFHENRSVQIGVVLLAALATTGFTIWLLLSHAAIACSAGDVRTECSVGDVLLAFFVFLLMWTFFFHVVAYNFGKTFLSARLGVNWVKSIDYVYLILSAFGILRIIFGILPTSGFSYVNLAAPF